MLQDMLAKMDHGMQTVRQCFRVFAFNSAFLAGKRGDTTQCKRPTKREASHQESYLK